MHVFLRIVTTLDNHDEYFQMRAPDKMGLSPFRKCIVDICMLA